MLDAATEDASSPAIDPGGLLKESSQSLRRLDGSFPDFSTRRPPRSRSLRSEADTRFVVVSSSTCFSNDANARWPALEPAKDDVSSPETAPVRLIDVSCCILPTNDESFTAFVCFVAGFLLPSFGTSCPMRTDALGCLVVDRFVVLSPLTCLSNDDKAW